MKKYDFTEADKKYFFDGELGAICSAERTVFRLWQPYADGAEVLLYKKGSGGPPLSRHAMTSENGVWSAAVSGDLNGLYYTYIVSDSEGCRESADIYAMSSGANGKRGLIFDPSDVCPEGWESSAPVKLASKTDAVIYELHVRDFSMDKNASFSARGKYTAFCETGVTNSLGDTVGLDYIAGLGVTHIHLMPVMDFASVDETAERPAYNWGYDPFSFNIPEGSYCSDADDGFCRIREFKAMISAIHRKGLGVILDVVYNHVYSAESSPFSLLFPHYYFRHDENGLSDGSGCGNEFASERKMARKFIVDSLCRLAREYKLDGFRFDLMGLIDKETLNLAAEKLTRINPFVLLYGEGWTGGASPLPEELRAVKRYARDVPGYSMFSDDFRDGIKGSVFSDTAVGYINGAACEGSARLIKSAMCGGVFHPLTGREKTELWTDDPAQSINYVECHDNLTFYDKLRLSMPEADGAGLAAAERLGAALMILAQGIPFLAAGQELLRSKPSPDGNGFSHNSYDLPDEVNCVKWDDVTKNAGIREYYAGLLAIRRRFGCFRMDSAEEIRAKILFEDLEGGAFLEKTSGFILAVNPLENPLEIMLDGLYDVYADESRASAEPLYRIDARALIKQRSVLLIRAVDEKMTIDNG